MGSRKINKQLDSLVARGAATLGSQRKGRKQGGKRGAKLRIARMSGEPLAPEHIELYKREYTAVYDKVQGRFNKTDTSVWNEEEADRANKLLQRCERIIRARYPTVGVTRWLTYSQLKRKMRYYGCPIQITEEMHSGNLAYVIVDIKEHIL